MIYMGMDRNEIRAGDKAGTIMRQQNKNNEKGIELYSEIIYRDFRLYE